MHYFLRDLICVRRKWFIPILSIFVLFMSEKTFEGMTYIKINPILHTAWLNNHAITLKSNTAKYYFGENPVFCIPSQNFVGNQGKFKSSSKHLNFNARSVLKIVNPNVWQAWFRSHHIFNAIF
jgi:hypothetical protein